MIEKILAVEELDAEWIQLIMEAKKIGIHLQDIQQFFKGTSE